MKILLTVISIVVCVAFTACSGRETPNVPPNEHTPEEEENIIKRDGEISEFETAKTLMANLSSASNAYIDDLSMNNDEYIKQTDAIKKDCMANIENGLNVVSIDPTMYNDIYSTVEEYVNTVFSAFTDISKGYRALSENSLSREDFKAGVVDPALEEIEKDKFMVKKTQDKYAYLFPEFEFILKTIGDYSTDIDALLERVSQNPLLT